MKELSRERFSLLNEDQKLDYIKEHSIFDDDLSKAKRQGNLGEPDTLFSLSNDEFENMINESFYDVFGAELINIIGQEEYNKVLKKVAAETKINESAENINESFPGIDAGPIMPKISIKWIVGLAFSGLGLIALLIAKLLSAGKQQIAIIILRKYMRKLVELIDNGLNKGRVTFGQKIARFIGFGHGEDNRSSFKSEQLFAERLACNYTAMAAKSGGILTDNGSTLNKGGIKEFENNFVYPLITSKIKNNTK